MNPNDPKLPVSSSEYNKKYNKYKSPVLADPVIQCARNYLSQKSNNHHSQRKIRTETSNQHSERIRDAIQEASTSFLFSKNNDRSLTSAAMYHDAKIHREHAKIFQAQNCLEDLLNKKPFATKSQTEQNLEKKISSHSDKTKDIISSETISDFNIAMKRMYSPPLPLIIPPPSPSLSSRNFLSSQNKEYLTYQYQPCTSQDNLTNLTYSIHSNSGTISSKDQSRSSVDSIYCKNKKAVVSKEEQFPTNESIMVARSTMDFLKNFSCDLKSIPDCNNNYMSKNYDDEYIEELTPPPSQRSLISIPSSIENFSYTPKVCPQYFYDWMDKTPMPTKMDYNANVYNCKVNNSVKMNGVRDPRSLRVEKKTNTINYSENMENLSMPSKNMSMKSSEKNYHDSNKKSHVLPNLNKNVPDKEQTKNLFNFPKWEGRNKNTEKNDHPCDCCKCQQKKSEKHKNKRQHQSSCNNKSDFEGRSKNGNGNYRNYVWENTMRTLRMNPARPDPFFIDDRKGTRHNYIRSGLAPIYILNEDFGKIPEYLEDRKKELGLPPTDLSSYRRRKRCYRCGHDHAFCELKKMDEEKLKEMYKQRNKNRSHNPGIVPVFDNTVCV